MKTRNAGVFLWVARFLLQAEQLCKFHSLSAKVRISVGKGLTLCLIFKYKMI